MLKSIGYKSTLITVSIAILGLLSHVTDMDLLGRISHEYIPMAPSTGISFLILGASLMLLYMKEVSKAILLSILIVSFSVSLFGILEVIGHFVDMDLNYEDSIVPIKGYLNGVPIARMSPATGALFFTSGISMIFFIVQKISLKQNISNRLLVDVFAYLSLIVSFTFCLSYLYGTPFLYETDSTIPMALTTALSFVFLSIAIIFIDENSLTANLYDDTSTRNYIFRSIFPISTLSVVVSGVVTIFTIQASIVNPALITATMTILIIIFVGLVSNHLSRHIGRKIDDAAREEEIVLIESEKRFRSVFDQAAIGVARVNLNGSWLEVNKKLCDIVGYTEEELLTKTFQDITHPDDMQPDLDYVEKLLSDEIKTYTLEKRYLKKSGDIVWINLTGSLARKVNDDPDYFIAIVEDITSQKRDQERLVESEERFRAVFEQAGGYSMILDPNTSDGIPIIVDANAAACEIHGYSREDFIGRPISDIDDEAGRLLVKKRTAEIMTGKPFFVENRHVRKDGTSFPVAVNANRVNIGGKSSLIFSNEYDISELKQTEEMLSKKEEILNLIIDSSPIGIATVDLLGNFVSTNPAYEKMLGYSKKELSLFSLFDITHPDHRPKNRELFQKMFSLKILGFYIEKVYICKDGKEIDVSVHATGISDESGNIKFGTAFIEDITEKKYALEQLEQKKKELETMIQEAPNPIMLHNEDGKVLMVNKTWELLTGYKYEDIDTIDKWTYLAYAERMSVVKEYIDDLYALKQKFDEGQYDVITKDGSIITWQFSSAPLGLIDGKRTVISSAMDITELKRKDEMLIDQSRHAAMGEMIGMIAHQWRQPLSIIAMDANNMLLDIALDDFDATAVEGYARNTLDQTQHLSKTIDDFRNFFKPDKELARIKLEDIIDETYAIVKDSLKAHDIALESSNESNEEVVAYSRELMQVFINIINNAQDALLAAKTKGAVIAIRVYDDEQYVNTEICDNGSGIDEAVLPKIFDPYFSTKDEKTGTGLGLYMSKMIIAEHLHGIIEARNTGNGACLTVRLLRIQDDEGSVSP